MGGVVAALPMIASLVGQGQQQQQQQQQQSQQSAANALNTLSKDQQAAISKDAEQASMLPSDADMNAAAPSASSVAQFTQSGDTASPAASGGGIFGNMQNLNSVAGLAGTLAKLNQQHPAQNVPTPQHQIFFPQSHEDLIMMLHRLASLGK